MLRSALIVLVVLAAGCGLDEARENADSPIFGAGISDEIDALEMVDPLIHEKLDDCVASGQFKAFNGDPTWQEVWQAGGRTVEGYQQHCERLAKNDPDQFAAIHTEWVAWESSTGGGDPVAAAPSPEPAPATVAPVTTPPPVTYHPSGCHPSYTPCVPIALDVDCRGSGNGPKYVEGPIQVIGYDEYRLDRGDGWGCVPDVPPTPPPTTVAPVTTPPPVTYHPSGCHPSYTPCVPIALDVDCRGSGNGPKYVEGPIQVIGYDEYRLDRGDGWGCMPDE